PLNEAVSDSEGSEGAAARARGRIFGDVKGEHPAVEPVGPDHRKDECAERIRSFQDIAEKVQVRHRFVNRGAVPERKEQEWISGADNLDWNVFQQVVLCQSDRLGGLATPTLHHTKRELGMRHPEAHAAWPFDAADLHRPDA